jgi:hypothetical protein
MNFRSLRPISLFVLCALLIPGAASAYLPPAFYLYSRIAEQKGKAPVNSVILSISRPQAAGTEEVLGSFTLQNWKATEGGWPTLSILFASDSDALIDAVSAFGLSVASEKDLLRVSREQLYGLKDPPHPFYKIDKTMSLKRARQTYAWVHSNKEDGKSVWVEKDTFLPLKIAAPCPAGVAALPWAKAGDNQCEVEFRNLYALRKGNIQNTKITLWKDGVPLLFFTFDRVAAARSNQQVADSRLPAELKSIVETIMH